MNSATDAIDAIRSRLPNAGDGFVVRDAARAMEDFYRMERLEGCDDDSLVVVAGKYGEGPSRHVEIALFRSLGLFGPRLEVSLWLPLGLRSLFLRTYCECCGSVADLNAFFSSFRSSRWFRRYATVPATRCVIRLIGEDEVEKMNNEIIPGLLEHMAPFLPRCEPPRDGPPT
jgi:hypothetical protein